MVQQIGEGFGFPPNSRGESFQTTVTGGSAEGPQSHIDSERKKLSRVREHTGRRRVHPLLEPDQGKRRPSVPRENEGRPRGTTFVNT